MNIATKQGARVRYANLTSGYDHDIERARKLLVPGKIYVVAKIIVHSWNTEVFLEGLNVSFNGVQFEEVDENAVDEVIEVTKIELPERLKAIIVDTDNAFVVRIATDPRTTDTGIANIIPTGISRKEKDYAIAMAENLVKCWND